MALVCNRVSVCWDLLCCDDTADFSTFGVPDSRLRLVNATTSTTQNVTDPDTCAELIPRFTVSYDPATGCVCTCELPANIGTDPATFLSPGGTAYEWTVQFEGQTRTYMFQLDADVDYSTVAVDGCIPVCELTLDTPAALDDDLLSDRVCELACITELTAEVAAVGAMASANATCCDENADAIADLADTVAAIPPDTNTTYALTSDGTEILLNNSDGPGNRLEICDLISNVAAGNSNTPLAGVLGVTPGGQCRIIPPTESDLLDCSGEPLTGAISPLTIQQGHAPAIVGGPGLACVDADCAPDLPECPIDGMVTFTGDGITWQIIGGAWVAVAVTPKEDTIAYAGGGAVVWTDADIVAGGTVACIEETYTNTDCVPQSGTLDVRVQVNSDAVPDNSWITALASGANNQYTLAMGQPTAPVDTNGYPPLTTPAAAYSVTGLLWNQYTFEGLAPGASVTFHACIEVTSAFSNPSPNNQIRFAGFTARLNVRRDVTCA